MCFDWAKLAADVPKPVMKTKGGITAADSTVINNDGLVRDERFRPQAFIYNMIETMLPKACIDEETKHKRLLEL